MTVITDSKTYKNVLYTVDMHDYSRETKFTPQRTTIKFVENRKVVTDIINTDSIKEIIEDKDFDFIQKAITWYSRHTVDYILEAYHMHLKSIKK